MYNIKYAVLQNLDYLFMRNDVIKWLTRGKVVKVSVIRELDLRKKLK